MKNVYLVGGTMGVGKITICQQLKRKLPNSVFLDGDWCWDADPFWVTEETKKLVLDNICFLLNQFIQCSVYDNIIFCWVMHQQEIIDYIVEQLNKTDCKIRTISLTAKESELRERLKKDIEEGKRTEDILDRSTERLACYNRLSTVKIDTDKRCLVYFAEEIAKL